MDKKLLTSAILGGAIGVGVNLAGDYWESQPVAEGQPAAIPMSDNTYNIFGNKSFLLNGVGGIIGIGAGVFGDKLKLSEEVAVGSAVAGTVALAHALRLYLRMTQSQTPDATVWAARKHKAYQRRALYPTVAQNTASYYNIK